MTDHAARDLSVDADLREHRETFANFTKLVLFGSLHIGLVLVCLALAFVGGIPVLALLLGTGGTLALIVAFAVLP